MRLLRIDHVQITVPRAREPEVRHFYGKVLGLPEVERARALPTSSLWYAFAQGTQLHVVLAEDPFKPPSGDHFAVVAEDLEAVKTRLGEYHVPYEPSQGHDGWERIFVRDPFGNRMEIIGPSRI